MKAYQKVVAAMIGLILMPLLALAQTEQALLAQLLEEEQKTVEALALYPANTRTDILEASKYPEALIKLETMQGKTSQPSRHCSKNTHSPCNRTCGTSPAIPALWRPW